ncbi:MAG: protein-tyrosine phosphatase [Ulvibacter sp.]|jgi:protein-tyrosine phosphatase
MLLDFFKLKKKGINTGFRLSFKRDIHAHLIPGVDDGPQTMEESLKLIQGFQKLGFSHLTATSHIYYQYYPNEKSKLIDAFTELKKAMVVYGIDIEIDLAAEYFLDDHFKKLLLEKELLPIANDYLLVEMPFVAPPPNVYEYFFDIQISGYKPILAHPERYMYLTTSDYEKLLDFGCQFQLNLLSLTGYYGKAVEKRAFTLLEKGWIHAFGSDIHNQHQMEAFERMLTNPKLSTLKGRHWLNDFL